MRLISGIREAHVAKLMPWMKKNMQTATLCLFAKIAESDCVMDAKQMPIKAGDVNLGAK